MIVRNLLTAWGLVNGTLGEVVDILWADCVDPFSTMPDMVTFRLDNYHVDAPCVGPPGSGLVPIIPIRVKWEKEGRHHERFMLPVVPSWAITIHKSQGMTLNQAVINLGKSDFAMGLTYVAISRVKALNGLMFSADFSNVKTRVFLKVLG